MKKMASTLDMVKTFRIVGVILLVLSAGLTGCAERKHVMRYGVESLSPDRRPFWPTPPDKPRYSYAGQLIGWENFPVVKDDKQELGEQALIWLTGLDDATGLGRREDEIKGLQRPQTGMVDEEGRIYVTDSGQGGWVGGSVSEDFIAGPGGDESRER